MSESLQLCGSWSWVECGSPVWERSCLQKYGQIWLPLKIRRSILSFLNIMWKGQLKMTPISYAMKGFRARKLCEPRPEDMFTLFLFLSLSYLLPISKLTWWNKVRTWLSQAPLQSGADNRIVLNILITKWGNWKQLNRPIRPSPVGWGYVRAVRVVHHKLQSYDRSITRPGEMEQKPFNLLHQQTRIFRLLLRPDGRYKIGNEK